MKKLTPEQLCVMHYMPKGKKNAISRASLCEATGYSDRNNRFIISQLRAEGNLICNSGTGYYLATDIEDIERQYWQDKARALSILKRVKAARKILKDAGRRV